MARPLRLHLPGMLYHVMSRGNARQQIFLGEDDYAYFLARLAATSARCGVRCLAHCLMPNHFHLLLEPSQLPLSRMMQQLNSSYSQRFNRRHQRVGHVLQGRFKALVIGRDDYFRRVLRYIVLNPVRAHVVEHPADWPWSSYRATAGLEAPPLFLALDDVWKAFDADGGARARRLYTAFVGADPSDRADAPSGALVFGSDALVARVAAALERYSEDREVVYAERFGCRPTLDRLFANAGDARARDRSTRDAFERHGYTLRQIGDFVGRSPATVWRRIRRAAERAAPGDSFEAEKIEI